ncbi:PilX N-terminal domain-containing pilus assembly protein [Dechloromonas sp. XY25]|uniref:PilX N-terminal domain-containing pilus assembly protein n=1 Tax=Dechloromonas hankyongensis TaxID=2908002 RepID=A0ABS9K564_9RHOO|nr:PilX N-terminal domain-containing pilus assembly protein [Dechloromonas hankyongensis]MCG2578314.1 PilX N-terminal domain-containing pilus assembly protein [Dechloromonas hankyongensis]
MTRQHIHLNPARSQQGATLMVVLIFLMVLSMLGVAAVQNNIFQEKMSGNTRDRELAFEAAEAAVRDASANIISLRAGPWTGGGGLSTYDANNANDSTYWNTSSNWSSYRNPSATVAKVATQPQYRIEKKPNIGTVEYYRVTARGFGADSTTIVIIQAEFTYTP